MTNKNANSEKENAGCVGTTVRYTRCLIAYGVYMLTVVYLSTV